MGERLPFRICRDPLVLGRVIELEDAPELDWSVDELSHRSGLSVSRFAHRFRDVVGEAPAEYLARIRLERAALHLRYSDWSITEVALANGYESHSGFTHAFTAQFGRSPSSFREAWRARPFLRTWIRRVVPTVPGVATDLSDRVEVVRMPSLKVAFLRQWGGLRAVPTVWEELRAWARSRGLAGRDARPIGLNYDDDVITSSARIRYDAGLIVDPDFDPRGEVGIREIPAGLTARLEFTGTVLGLYRAWGRFVGEWLCGSGYQLRTTYAFDLHAAGVLSDSRVCSAFRQVLRIRSTMCIPVRGAEDEEPLR